MTYPQTRRPRRRWGRRLVITLVAVIVLLVVIDRVSLVVAERLAADTLQRSQQLPQRPDVSIDGFPFLTQLAGERFGEIEVGVSNLVVGSGDQTLTLSRLHIALHDVRVSDSFHRATSRSGTATALLTYGELSRVLHTPISYGGNGSVVARATVSAAGVSVSGTVAVTPVLVRQELRFADPHVTVAGTSVPGADAALVAVLDRPIDLSSLPFGLHVDAVAAATGGVSVTLSAANLSYRR